ncbi:hotdog fold thioesterase [bacterium]|nr:hotdog fold thioesterase [bacterium]
MTNAELPRSPFPENIGIEILEASAERVVAALDLEERHCNSHDLAHGGVIFTLADHAFGVAENLGDEKFVAQEMHVRFLRPSQAAENIISEIGVDMSRFPSANHLSAWGTISPGNNESAGKRKSGKMSHGNRWLRTTLV